MGSFVVLSPRTLVAVAGVNHNILTNLTVGDVHTQLVKVTGRATPQVISLGTAAGATTGALQSTSDATKGSLTVGLVHFDELNGRLGLNRTAPDNYVDIEDGALAYTGSSAFVSAADSMSGGDSGNVYQNILGLTNISVSTAKKRMRRTPMQEAKGGNVASAAAIAPDSTGNLFLVTGSTQVDHMSILDRQAGTKIKLELGGAITITNETGSPPANHVAFKLDLGASLVGATGDMLVVVYNGTHWREVKRSIA